ncbi:hypothetical protein PBI_COOPER_51 [Mycobacterium phage Cooper]|uniref:Uncharacterized protein n=1 Tax=Mycobacterium phage Cooper TaxID=373406 RepID=Q1A065_9CAUD|nr:gp51 [Mycobacterium phage Cooper]ABD58168.1 hypothetical protein PBI_COOPER_51 [Mycobacterium phage Cooper]
MASLPTSITFDKQALIKTAETALAVHGKADEVYQADLEKYKADHAPDSKIPQLVALRDELSRFLRTKREPTAADARKFRNAVNSDDYLRNLYTTPVDDRDARNNVARPAGWLSPSQRDSYLGLVAMLKAHVGETITANQLKLFGYTNLEALFRAAATAGGAK